MTHLQFCLFSSTKHQTDKVSVYLLKTLGWLAAKDSQELRPNQSKNKSKYCTFIRRIYTWLKWDDHLALCLLDVWTGTCWLTSHPISSCLLVSGEWAESSTPEPAGCSADPSGQSASNHHADQGSEGVWHRGRQGNLGAPTPQPAAPQPASTTNGGGT